jgi:aromatic amino acid aminotransferase I
MAPPSATAVEVEGVRDTEGIPLPDPLTVNGVSARREKAGKLIAGTAAYTSSDFFKTHVCPPMPLSIHLLTSVAS